MINENCPCKNVGCERHGSCDACREFHHTVGKRPLTSCEMLARENEPEAPANK